MSGQLFCTRPFDWMEIGAWPHTESGNWVIAVSLCCPSWGHVTLCNFTLQNAAYIDLLEVFNSPKARAIRRSILDGTFLYCRGCPRYATSYDPVYPVDAVPEPWLQQCIKDRTLILPGPRRVNLGYDCSCNLHCPSCRLRATSFSPGDPIYRILEHFQTTQVTPLLKQAEWAFFSATGDPFGSRLYREYLSSMRPEDYPKLKLYIHSNGILFAHVYPRLAIRDQIRKVQFSVDAATAGTYRENRGGAWGLLHESLAMVHSLISRGKLDELHLSMVVQQNNWREIPAFVEMAKRYRASHVMLYGLLNWGHWSKAEFDVRCVTEPGCQHYDEFIALVRALQGAEHDVEIHLDLYGSDYHAKIAPTSLNVVFPSILHAKYANGDYPAYDFSSRPAEEDKDGEPEPLSFNEPLPPESGQCLSEIPERVRIVAAALRETSGKTFMEIGIGDGRLFTDLTAFRIGIDINRQPCEMQRDIEEGRLRYFEMTSDDFFATRGAFLLKHPPDVVLIDGNHVYAQALRDFENSQRYLAPNGIILFHDANPTMEAMATPAANFGEITANPPPNWTLEWTGDVWKTIVYLRSLRRDFRVCVLDCDYGVAIAVRRPPLTMLDYTAEEISQMTYADLVADRERLLDLRAPSSLLAFLG